MAFAPPTEQPGGALEEIGLLGEVRAVSRAAERVREAAALGFERIALSVRDAAADLQLATTPLATVADLPGLLQATERVGTL